MPHLRASLPRRPHAWSAWQPRTLLTRARGRVPLHCADRIIYFTAAGAAICSSVFIYLAWAALSRAYLSEERSAERKDENGGGTTVVDVRNSGDFTSSGDLTGDDTVSAEGMAGSGII